MVENDESMDAPKSILFRWKYNNYEKDTISSNPWTLQNLSISLGNTKIPKISRSNQKSGTPRMLIITCVFEEKTMLRLHNKNQGLQEFEAPQQKSGTPRMLTITVVFEGI